MELLSVEERSARLDDEVRRYVSRRYRVESRNPTSAQLVKPRRFSVWWCLFWTVVTLGPGLLIYPLWWLLFMKDKGLYLEVDEAGKIRKT